MVELSEFQRQRRAATLAKYKRFGGLPPGVDEDPEAEVEAAPEAEAAPLDPSDYTVTALEAFLGAYDDPAQLRALLDAERRGKDRVTAIEAIERRLRALNAE